MASALTFSHFGEAFNSAPSFIRTRQSTPTIESGFVLMSRLRLLARVLFPFIPLASCAPPGFAECVSYSEAMKHIGATKCVTGKVLRVKQGNAGVHFF